MIMLTRVLLLVAVVVGLAGCSADGLSTVPVSGKVTYKGQPVEGADVIFHSQAEEGRNGSGRTDAEGKFQLSTYVRPDYQPAGVVAGEYKVTVTKLQSSGQSMSPEDMMKKMQASGGAGMRKAAIEPPKGVLPAKYADVKTSDLKATVSTETAELTFELTD